MKLELWKISLVRNDVPVDRMVAAPCATTAIATIKSTNYREWRIVSLEMIDTVDVDDCAINDRLIRSAVMPGQYDGRFNKEHEED